MSDPRVIILCGPGAAGKTTVANWLVENAGYSRVRSVTTRPPRSDKDDEYYFVSPGTYEILEGTGETMLPKSFHIGDEVWWYALLRKQALDFENKLVFILDPYAGLRLRTFHGADSELVFVNADQDIRRRRMESRGDSFAHIQDRVRNDNEMFERLDRDLPHWWNRMVVTG